MKNLLLQVIACVLFVLSTPVSAQKMFDYERDISGKENYNFQEITFKIHYKKKDSIKLYGTLITPKVKFDKVIIIVPGSGADTRYSHYKLTEKLLGENIAVFKYDERGIGDSEGKYAPANTTIEMMSSELVSCIKILRCTEETRGKKIGLLGHSQGGMAVMDAYAKGLPADFLIQWATPVQKHGKFLEHQLKTRSERFDHVFKYETFEEKLAVMTALHAVIEQNKELDGRPLWKKLDKAAETIGYGKEHYERFPYLTLSSEKSIVKKDFEPVYKNIKIPVLYIVGSADVFIDPIAEIALLESMENSSITIKKFNGLNHYLTNGVLRADSSMYNIDNNATDEIIQWIKKL